MNRRKQLMLAAAAAVFLAVAAAVVLPVLASRRERPHGFGPGNFVKIIGRKVIMYAHETGAPSLPGDLRTVSERMGLDSPKRLVGYDRWLDDVPFDRIRYVGAGKPIDSPARTPVVVCQLKSRGNDRPSGYVYYLDDSWAVLGGDEWLAIWTVSRPTDFGPSGPHE